MALTITDVRNGNLGGFKVAIADVQFDSSYPTSGETLDLTAAPFTVYADFTSVYAVAVVEGPYDSAGAKIVPSTCSSIHYDFDTSRAVASGVLLAYAENGTTGIQAQVANTTDLSTVYCRLLILGS